MKTTILRNINFSAITFVLAIYLLFPLNAFSQGAGFFIDLARKGNQASNLGAGPGASVDLYLGQLNANLGQPQNTFVVTNLDDSGVGSLRQAILDANTSSGYDAINFQSGLTGTIALTSGRLDISESVKIDGPGANIITVSGENLSKIIEIFPVGDSEVVYIKGITIANGGPNQYGTFGGGIRSTNTDLILEDVVVTNCKAAFGGGVHIHGKTLNVIRSTISNNFSNWYGEGGGIYGYANSLYSNTTIIISDSTISDNESESTNSSGGGVYNLGEWTEIKNSTINNNTAARGSGIYSQSPLLISNSTINNNTGQFGAVFNLDTLNMVNSTVSNNSTPQVFSGAVYNYGTANIVNSTISHNQGFGIYNVGSGITNIVNSIVAANQSFFGADIGGVNYNSFGNNLIGRASGGEGFTSGVNGDKVGTSTSPIDPRLGDLQNNGGATETRALLAGSPAINSGNNCVAAAVDEGGCVNPPLTTDQRGEAFPRQVAGQVDIGAFESDYTNQPTDKEQCKKDGWRLFNNPRLFENQGDCIQFVITGK